MIRLIFEDESHSVVVGPAPWFRIAGNFIRQGPHGSIAGTFRLHHWEVGGHHFSRYDCKEPALIYFEDFQGTPSEEFGPFPFLFAQDGAMHAGSGLFAKFIEDTQLWHSFPTETFWPVVVIKAVGGAVRA
jgi:hypothetical protein